MENATSMKIKAYMIWNVDESRPVINRDNYGNILSYLSKENAMALLSEKRKFDSDLGLDLREIEITVL